jgi:hypothetical protein
LTNFALAERSRLEGRQPRHLWIPDYVDDSHGRDAVELAESIGLTPDPWQRDVTIALLAVGPGGKWAAFEFGLEVPRQNGKGGVYEIRELYGLFVLREKLLIHSAHEYKTAEQALDRMEALIDGCDDLRREVRTIKRSHGQEGIYLKTGQVLRYFTRTASGGRGFSCDFLGLDEAMKIKHSMHAAMFPTMSARPNPQILYAGSAVDKETMDDGIVFARVRERGIAGGDPRLAYFGYSAPFDHPDEVTEAAAIDPENWAAANPALGMRITEEYIDLERRALSGRGFCVERLGVGDWPSTSEHGEQIIDVALWKSLLDTKSAIEGPVCFSYDITPGRTRSAVAVSGLRPDGLLHSEVIAHELGTDWVVDRVVELVEKHDSVAVLCDADGQGASLVPKFEDLGVTVTALTASEHAQACGTFFDGVDQRGLRHTGPPELEAAMVSALKGAAKRTMGDGRWGWSRKSSSVDISPLVCSTLALWGASTKLTTGEPLIAWR